MKMLIIELIYKLLLFIFWIFCLIMVPFQNTLVDVLKYSIPAFIISFDTLLDKRKEEL